MLCSVLYAALQRPPPFGFVNRRLHRRRHGVGVHDDAPVEVAGRASGRLNQRSGGAQKALLVGVQDRHERDFGQIKSFAQQVDADEHVEHAPAEVAQDLDPLERVDVRVQVADLDAKLLVVRRQVLSHALRQRGDEDPLPERGALPDLLEQIVDLAAHRANLDRRIHQTRSAE